MDEAMRDVYPTWRVGIDTGGTFADLVAMPPDDRPARVTKIPRDAGPRRLADALLKLGVAGDALVVHGTTHVTNAVLEARFARTALVTTCGFGDVLRIGRQARDHLYALGRPARMAAIVGPELTFELDERCRPDGTVVRPIDGAQLAELAAWARSLEVEAVAVCLLHAYANPSHERRVREVLGDLTAVSLSHEVSGEAREYERAAATVLNAALQGGTRAYLKGLEEAIGEALPGSRLFVVQSAGGMVPTAAAAALPVATVMSGPAAGVTAASMLTRRTGVARAVTCDIGGTSTDVALIVDGTPTVTRDRCVGGRVVRVPAIAVDSIAIGGGSIIAVDDVGALSVGPRSAGARPGPACYGHGGDRPTITDAALACGLIGAGGGVAGLDLRLDLALDALQRVATPLGLDATELAWRAVDIAQETIATTLGTVVARRGYDIRECVLVAYGGGGPVHAGPLALRLGIQRLFVPAMAPVLSALGCCLAEVGVDAVRTHRVQLDGGSLRALERTADELARTEIEHLEESAETVAVDRWLELRYLGQNSELAVPWTNGASAEALAYAFADVHEREYGFVSPDPVEVVAVRCRLHVAGAPNWPASVDQPCSQAATANVMWSGGVHEEVPVIGLAELADGRAVSGPALIAARFGSITICKGQRAQLDTDATVVVEAE
jgi:N-methylhydantoinase A